MGNIKYVVSDREELEFLEEKAVKLSEIFIVMGSGGFLVSHEEDIVRLTPETSEARIRLIERREGTEGLGRLETVSLDENYALVRIEDTQYRIQLTYES